MLRNRKFSVARERREKLPGKLSLPVQPIRERHARCSYQLHQWVSHVSKIGIVMNRNEWALTIFNFLSISSPCCIAKSSRWARTRKTTINAEERQTCSSGREKVFHNLVKFCWFWSLTIIAIKFQVTSPWLWIVLKCFSKFSRWILKFFDDCWWNYKTFLLILIENFCNLNSSETATIIVINSTIIQPQSIQFEERIIREFSQNPFDECLN